MIKPVFLVVAALALLVTPTLANDHLQMKGIGWYVILSHDRDALADFYRAIGF